MARSGRLVWIKSVLRSVPIYAMMAENLPQWAPKEIDAICRKFLWAGTDASVRGKCTVAWPVVCKPTQLGGLVINYRPGGCGCRELTVTVHGPSCQSKPRRKCRPSSERQPSSSSVTGHRPASGNTGGSVVNQLLLSLSFVGSCRDPGLF